MPFEPRTFSQILDDMINYVRTNSTLTDFNRGSVIRTILETAALEDDEQYYQMVQILREFSFRTATGEGLVRRAADFNLVPLTASPAFGEILFMDTNLERSYLASNTSAGAGSLVVEDASVFSALTPPFDVRIGEGTSVQEDVEVSSITVATGTLTLTGTASNDHIGLSDASLSGIRDEFYLDSARVSYVSGDPDENINSGEVVAAPAVGELPQVRFLTTDSTILENGDFKSALVAVRAERPGIVGNVGPLRIVSFPTTVPFSGALVVNPSATGGGIEAETDAQFAERISLHIASLSRGTLIAIRNYLLQVEVAATGQRVARLGIVEEFVTDPELPGTGTVKIYIDDGTGSFVPESDAFAKGNLLSDPVPNPGASSISVNVTEGTFSSAGFLIIDPSDNAEVVEYTSYTGTPAVFQINGFTLLSHDDDDLVLEVEEVDDDVEEGQFFFDLGNIAVVEENFRLFSVVTVGYETTVTELVRFDPDIHTTLEGKDFLLNGGVGQIEILADSELPAGSGLYAYYENYTGLIELAQRTIDGDIRNPSDFPGVRSAGVKALVLPADRLVVNVTIRLIIEEGFDNTELRERADRVIRNYINGLGAGADFIVNEMIERVMGITGMFDLEVLLPTSNIVVPFDEVAIPGTIDVS